MIDLHYIGATVYSGNGPDHSIFTPPENVQDNTPRSASERASELVDLGKLKVAEAKRTVIGTFYHEKSNQFIYSKLVNCITYLR